MCGICGIIGERAEDIVKTMAQTIVHRGPDEEGYFFTDKISLANRRLSIIDLSTGSQPIYNEDKSIVVVYNGEIYNYQPIREDLIKKGHKFYTNSDTEIIVHAYEEYGVNCLKHFNGDFAFALYDINKDQTFIARDRLGIRPLYYSIVQDKIIFASELKALMASGLIKKELNYKELDKYLTLRYCFGQETLIKEVYKLPAANYMLIKDGNVTIKQYWSVNYTPEYFKSYRDYTDKFEEIFDKSVQIRMISDVPFGAFLSGGVDSSLIVALMAKHSTLPVETYSIGFGLDIDETNDSKMLADHFGCHHHEIKIQQQSYNLLPEIIKYFDEPLGDAIIIPTYILAREASKNIKVVLTGEGADEIFGAYVHHFAMHYGNIFNKLTTEGLKKHLVIPAIEKAPLEFLDKIFPYPSSLGHKGKEKLLNYINLLNNPVRSYFSIASMYSPEDKSKLYTSNLLETLSFFDVEEEFSAQLDNNKELPLLNRLIDLDIKYWLADYTLFKQDIITMSNSIEGRIPYLDHNLVEFVSSVPIEYKLNGINTKYLLRKVAKKYLPKPVAFKKKKAFYFPYQQCFGEDFNIYLKDLFNTDAFIFKLELIRKNELEKLCKNILHSEILSSKQLMSLIILENWLRIYLK